MRPVPRSGSTSLKSSEGERDLTAGQSQLAGEAGGSRSAETRTTVRAAPTTYGTGRHCQMVRVRLAARRRCTRGTTVRSPVTVALDSNLTDTGRDAARGRHRFVRGLPTPKPGHGSGGEAMLKACGVGMARLPGYRWTPPSLIDFVVNVGTIRSRPSLRTTSPAAGRSVVG